MQTLSFMHSEDVIFLFVRYKTFLSEDAGPETLVAIVHANDPDGDAVSYAVTGGNEDSNFLLDNQKGEGGEWGMRSMFLNGLCNLRNI